MEIDLVKLAKLKLTINEYLTLVKLDKLSEGVDFPFRSTVEHIKLLEGKGYIVIDQFENIELTSLGESLTQGKDNINFDELFDIYPSSTPQGRLLRVKSKEIAGRLTKEYKFLRAKYLAKVKDNDTHRSVVKATKAMVKDKTIKGSLEYIRKLEFYISRNEWEQYIDSDGSVEEVNDNQTNIERL